MRKSKPNSKPITYGLAMAADHLTDAAALLRRGEDVTNLLAALRLLQHAFELITDCLISELDRRATSNSKPTGVEP